MVKHGKNRGEGRGFGVISEGILCTGKRGKTVAIWEKGAFKHPEALLREPDADRERSDNELVSWSKKKLWYLEFGTGDETYPTGEVGRREAILGEISLALGEEGDGTYLNRQHRGGEDLGDYHWTVQSEKVCD